MVDGTGWVKLRKLVVSGDDPYLSRCGLTLANISPSLVRLPSKRSTDITIDELTNLRGESSAQDSRPVFGSLDCEVLNESHLLDPDFESFMLDCVCYLFICERDKSVPVSGLSLDGYRTFFEDANAASVRFYFGGRWLILSGLYGRDHFICIDSHGGVVVDSTLNPV